jgi:hypothetical protein
MKKIKISNKQYKRLFNEGASESRYSTISTAIEKGIDLKPKADSEKHQTKWTKKQKREMKKNGYDNILKMYPDYVPELVSNPKNIHFELDLIDVLVDIEKKSGVELRVTAGNDKFHSGKNSKHRVGRAVDFTPLNMSESESDQKAIENAVFEIAKGNDNLSFINEYMVSTKSTTGGHFHISLSNNGEMNYYHFIKNPKTGKSPFKFNSKENKLSQILNGKEIEPKDIKKKGSKGNTKDTKKEKKVIFKNLTDALAKVGFRSADKEVSYELVSPKEIIKKKGGNVAAKYVKETVLNKESLFESAYNFNIERAIVENWFLVKDDGTKKPLSDKLSKQFDSASSLVSKTDENKPEDKAKVNTWDNYACITVYPGAEKTKMSNNSIIYKIGEVYFYNSGRCKDIKTKKLKSYKCENGRIFIEGKEWSPSTEKPEEKKSEPAKRVRDGKSGADVEYVTALKAAIEGIGTDEEKVYEVLGKLNKEELDKIDKHFMKNKGISVLDYIRDDFSGEELNKLNDLINKIK